jgi:hypothetical protein
LIAGPMRRNHADVIGARVPGVVAHLPLMHGTSAARSGEGSGSSI